MESNQMMTLEELKELVDATLEHYGKGYVVVTSAYNREICDHFDYVERSDFSVDTRQKFFKIF
jgi:dissimilatory sulfite reductase (desulfoviridin) alpha/beta subunit